MGSYSVQQTHVTVPRRQACNHTTPRQQGNLRLTHLRCSQFTWSRNQGRVTSSHAADSVTFAEREYEIQSPDHRQQYTRVVNAVLRHSNVLHLHQQVCHKIGNTIVRTSRFTLLKIFLAYNSFHHLLIRSLATVLRRRKNCYGSLAPVCVGPACPLLQ